MGRAVMVKKGPRAVAMATGVALAAGALLALPGLAQAAQAQMHHPKMPHAQMEHMNPTRYMYGYTPQFSMLHPTAPMHPTAQEMRQFERLNANCGGDQKCHFDGRITPVHLRGDVYLLVGEPNQSNVVVQAGDEGTLVVDTGVQAMAPQLLAAIRETAADASRNHTAIRWIVDTDSAADHIGGNEVIRKAGSSIVAGNVQFDNPGVTPGAVIIGNQNLLNHLVMPPKGMAAVPPGMWPTETHDEPVYSWYFNNEAVRVYHPRVANTNGNSMVMFRQSDVLATGDVLDMDTYPIIVPAEGGTIDGELTALNHVMDLAVAQHQQDIDVDNPGTIVIPGHGRLANQSDVQHYINVVTVIRNRVMYYKDKGKTLEQVLALKPSWDYDGRWGGTKGPWTTRDFVEAVYNTLPRKGSPVFSIPHVQGGGG